MSVLVHLCNTLVSGWETERSNDVNPLVSLRQLLYESWELSSTACVPTCLCTGRHGWRKAWEAGNCSSTPVLSVGKPSVCLLWLYLVSMLNYKWSCGVSLLTEESGYRLLPLSKHRHHTGKRYPWWIYCLTFTSKPACKSCETVFSCDKDKFSDFRND